MARITGPACRRGGLAFRGWLSLTTVPKTRQNLWTVYGTRSNPKPVALSWTLSLLSLLVCVTMLGCQDRQPEAPPSGGRPAGAVGGGR